MSLPIAILAGGLATRLKPITEQIPKSLVEVSGKPFIRHQLAWLSREGITKVVLCVGHLGQMIESVVGSGGEYGLDVLYSFDGPTQLGTGGALRKALPLLGDAFFVLYGDSYLRLSLREVEMSFRASPRAALMTVYKNNQKWDTSNVLVRDEVVVKYDKLHPNPDMHYIDYGLGVLGAPALMRYHPHEAFDLAEVYTRLAVDGELAAYFATERFYEIGSLPGIEETDRFLRNQDKGG